MDARRRWGWMVGGMAGIVAVTVWWGCAVRATAEAPRPTESAYTEETDYGYYIEEDTVWKKTDTLVFDKPVFVQGLDGPAKLTIEAGAEVHVNGEELDVEYGSIVAQGTSAAQVTFLSDDGAPFTLKFRGNAEDGSTLLSHVRVQGGGKYVESGCGVPMSYGGSFIPTAQAAEVCAITAPAVEYWSGNVRIEDADFVDNRYADIVSHIRLEFTVPTDNRFTVSHSSLADNVEHTAVISEATCTRQFYPAPCPATGDWMLQLDNDWYGAADSTAGSGPDETFFGETRLSGTYAMNGWLPEDPFVLRPTCAGQCYSNVLFLPGLEASRLYVKDGTDENRLWEPGSDADAEKLRLDGQGRSLRDDIYTRDVIDNAYLPLKGNIYASFLHDLDSWKRDGTIGDYAVVPYDWRLSFEDLLTHGVKIGENISYHESGTYVIDELRRLAAGSKSGKVTVIAHSNGGLLAKALVDALGAEEAAWFIDDIVFVAVPQSGTPQTVASLLHGDGQGLPIDLAPFALSPVAARTLAHDMPSAYPLLPSSAYFEGTGSGTETPPVSFDDGALTQAFIDTYGHTIGDKETLDAFLLDTAGKISPDTKDVYTPATVNPQLLASGNEAHRKLLDQWTVPDGITLYQIAGFGEETAGTIRYWTGRYCAMHVASWCVGERPELLYTPEMVVEGDGTVIEPSALAMSPSENVKRYWVRLDDYNEHNIDRKHADIFEVQDVRDFIRNNVITKSADTLPVYISDSEPPTSTDNRLRFYLHSPLALSVSDDAGREVSASAAEIPGAEFRRFGELQYLSVPAEAHPKLRLTGQEDGSFSLEVREVQGDTTIAATTFTGVPVSPQTEATMDFPDGTVASADPLEVDYDSDGEPDLSLAPTVGGTVTPQDTVPPATTASVAGDRRESGWYWGDATVTLTATDDPADAELSSGVRETRYSVDGGAWNIYTGPFVIQKEGRTTITYMSVDNAGNEESGRSMNVDVDRTAPEARVAFDPEARKVTVIGQDGLGGPVAVFTTDFERSLPVSDAKDTRGIGAWLSRWFPWQRERKETLTRVTLSDEAGHVTELVYKKTQDRDGRMDIAFRSLAYDGVETGLRDTDLQYRWEAQRRTGKYLLFATSVRAGTERTESHYFPWNDETWLMESPWIFGSDDAGDIGRRPAWKKLPGMVIVGLETDDGIMKVVY